MATQLSKKTKPNIVDIMAAKYNLDPEKFKATIKATVMRPGKDGRQATDEEFMAFLMVANKYDLDPFTNEIYAFLVIEIFRLSDRKSSRRFDEI